MKSLIFKHTSTTNNGKTGRVAIYVLGVCIYSHEYPEETEPRPRRIGFIQYPNDAPGYIEDEDYYPEEF